MSEAILHAILSDLETFVAGESAHDDRTLVVIKNVKKIEIGDRMAKRVLNVSTLEKSSEPHV